MINNKEFKKRKLKKSLRLYDYTKVKKRKRIIRNFF